MLTKMHIYFLLYLWIRPVEKFVENVENSRFSTAIFRFLPYTEGGGAMHNPMHTG